LEETEGDGTSYVVESVQRIDSVDITCYQIHLQKI